ncbi:hypothetical protein LQG66_07425 [Bradyrhizobium ontarionense]|uniref:Uncharacterized protein n=1 Tax=Bradyrhizobium ontarionense TaxID=2898149 RepID=A0ABY3RF90_9BRAD|nr:hypothetical protein [Bradyrhizobium sp. A19]UFZ06125.1 hypothetical protein LQG66_07425 [Bradyrhizobium sp. A19]
MLAEWKVRLGQPKFAAPRLASLQAASPSNAHSPETIGIFVALWCGRDMFDLSTNSGEWLSYGFRIGEIRVDVKGGFISPQGRFKLEFCREKIDQTASRIAARGGPSRRTLSASLKQDQISRGSQVYEEKRGEFFRVVWRVADAGHNTWKVFGDGLNAENVLEHKIIGDDPLFFVEPNDDADEVRVTVSYFGDLFGLWIDEQAGAAKLNGSESGLRTKQAICAAVLAKSLRTSDDSQGERFVLLCQQRLIATRVR